MGYGDGRGTGERTGPGVLGLYPNPFRLPSSASAPPPDPPGCALPGAGELL